jgi:eukaryotic-like serine/threonine-protein kinase
MVEPGTLLAARYRIERFLGRGQTGAVYEAIDERRSGLRVAIKLLVERHPQALYRLKNEFRALAETVHTNLVGLHGLGTDPVGWFVVMDLIEPSSDFLTYVRQGGSACDIAKLRAALVQLVRGVGAIHAAKKVHRDLKPRNVLVTPEGRVVIVDFGLVGDSNEGGVGRTLDGVFVGTPAYAAPEQAYGQGFGSADLYAVGVMLYEALTGKLPIEGESARQLLERKASAGPVRASSLARGVPSDLDALCSDLLEPDPECRPDALEVLRRLNEFGPTPAVPGGSRFVARERELARLHEVLQSTRSGTSALVIIRGPSGIGKTALLNHFLDHARQSAGGVALAGRCHAQEQLPFKAFDTLIDALGRYLIGLSAVEAASLMPREVTLLARLFPTLYRVPAVLGMPPTRDADWDDAMLRARAFSALKELLARIADRGTLVLGFDDLQWTDQDSTDLLRELMRSPGAPACLFVCAMRDSGDASWLTAPGAASVSAVELRLEPLDPAASAELARALLGDAVTEQDVELVVSEATGSPFLLEQLSRDARDRGGSRGLRAAVDAQVAKLSADAKALLELVCSAGHPLELAVAIDAPRAEAPSVRALLSSSLVRTSVRHGTEYLETHHDRIGEVVAEGIEPSRRREIHQQLAETLVQRQHPDSDLIASHFRAAGLPELAALHTLAAAEQAKRVFAFGRAAELYEVATAEADASRRPGLELALAETYANVGRLTEAAELYEKLAGLPELHRERRGLTQQAMVLHLLVGNVEPGARLLSALCQELGLRPLPRSRWLALLMVLLLVLRYRLGPRIAALPVPEESRHRGTSRERLDLCIRAGRACAHWSIDQMIYFSLHCGLLVRRYRDRARWPAAMAWDITWRCVRRGSSFEHEDRWMSDALALAENDGDDEELALVLATEGTRAMYTARFTAGDRTMERVEQVLAGSGRSMATLFNRTRSARLAGWICAGRLGEVLAHSDAWLADARALGDRGNELIVRLLGSMGLLAIDDVSGARDALSGLETPFARESSFIGYRGFEGEVALYAGDAAGAMADYRKATRARFFAPFSQFPYTRCWSSLLLARAYLLWAREDSSRRAHRQRLAAREARRLARLRFGPAEGAAAMIRGALAAQRGDHESAVLLLQHAARAFDRDGVLLYAAAVRDRLGKLRQGDEGAALVNEATLAAKALGVRTPERWFRSLLPGFSD